MLTVLAYFELRLESLDESFTPLDRTLVNHIGW
jgi:hypothetical protein